MPAAKSLKVLVVDDQQTMRGLARQCLKRLGVVDVALAATADAALDALNQKKFDVVISDLNMPGNQDLRFIRFEVLFDISVTGQSTGLSPNSPIPTVEHLRMPFMYP